MPFCKAFIGSRLHACCALALAALAAIFILIGHARADPARELVLLNWEDYLDPALIAAFEARYNVQVRQVYFDDDEARDRMLVKADGRGYDVAVVNGEAMASYRASGWLEPVDRTAVPNLVHVDPLWRTIFPAADGFAMPYFWGVLGIAYRSDLLPGPLTSWMQFFAPEAALRHRISMTGSGYELIAMALKACGYSANSADPAAHAESEGTLQRQKPFVQTYDYIDFDANSPLLSGEIVAAMMYNGDAVGLAQLNPDIRFVVPEEGGNLWVDYLAVMAKARNRDLAYAFVDFLNEPANAAQNATVLHYATPNMAAEILLPAAFLDNPTIYPPDDVLARSEVNRRLPARVERRRAMIYVRLVN